MIHSPIAEKTRDLIAPISDYSLYLCHEGTGTTLTDSAPAAQQLLGDITVNGTTAGIWGTESNFTPAGDHTSQKASAAQLAAGNLSTLNGQMIFFVDIYATGVPSTNFNTILMYGNTSGANLIRFTIETTNGRFQVQTKDSAGTTVSAHSGVSVCDSTRHSCMAVINALSGELEVFLDGISVGNNNMSVPNMNISQSRGWGVLANITSDAPAYNTHLGSQGITGLYINRMGLMRTTSDQSANIGSIATGLSKIAHELPWAMDGI